MMVMGREGKVWADATPPNVNNAIAAQIALRIRLSIQYFAVIARSEATKQSILPVPPDGLLRCARNDG
jgi:hypothetical protein